jgi:hypothetical protein
MKPLTALDALGYMHDEKRIIKIRNVTHAIELDKKEIMAGKQAIILVPISILSDTWEIGYECDRCFGSGEISVQAENGQWDDVKCPVCEAGIVWKSEF